MTTKTEGGFTIIEVILFLAVTGALFAALMIGASVNITQQRYLDSVRSYKALLQDQYSEVINTRNEAVSDWRCGGDGDGSIEQVGPRDTRGTSRCVLLGRAIQITEGSDGREVATTSITGYDNGGQDDASDDITAINNYQPKLGRFDTELTAVDWDGQLVGAISRDDRPASTAVILIIRSPSTGVIKVFTSEMALRGAIDLSGMITTERSSAAAVLRNCMMGDSGMLPKQLVRVDPRIASPDGVAIIADQQESEVCQ